MTATLKDIRSTFLNYFAKHDHKIIPSSSLVPDNDPTLMFTNSGMVQFKHIFTGNEKRDYTRATTSQKSVRAGGKHNDLDNVGYTVRHHTFFEMLGNFSFGDYFKDDAIAWAWELVTKEFGLPKDRLAVTVFHNDDEAYNIWKKVAGLPDDRIIRIATKDNFWQMGDTGPCGPCSEIFYDHGPEVWGGLPGTPEEDGDRWIEIWNLVFDQFEDLPDGSRIPLKQKCIDTGMGLERISAILQGVHSNYDIDLFRNLIADIANLANSDPNGPLKASHNVIADHLRSTAFLIADGVLPSNEGRGYVLRRIMRRAMRHIQLLGVRDPMLYKLLPSLQREMGEAYPELYRAEALITETIKAEETRFIRTLDKGLKILDDETANLKAGDELSGATAFKLYDTYGFPLDLTQDALRSKNIKVDTKGFDEAMAKQKAEARKNWAGSGDAGTEKVWFDLQEKLGATEFLGYTTLHADGQVTALVVNNEAINAVSSGEFWLVANQTPFYAEMGGQVGDTGVICGDGVTIHVTDVKKKLDGISAHLCKLIKGTVKVGDNLSFIVNEQNRKDICANHSVTHLLHRALRDVLGEHVTQKGSAVGPDRMRFDISHPKQVTAEEIRQVENIVNNAIRHNYKVTTTMMSQEDAIKSGAMALFGEKYGDTVRVVDASGWSTEFCGGTHVKNTAEVGCFKVLSEASVAAGIRRIEGTTGWGVRKLLEEKTDVIAQVAGTLKVSNVRDLPARAAAVAGEVKALQKELDELKAREARSKLDGLFENAKEVQGVKLFTVYLTGTPTEAVRAMCDAARDRAACSVAAIIAENEGKYSLAVAVGKEAQAKGLAAGRLAKEIASVAGGNGGGKPDFAMAGIRDASKIDDALNAVPGIVEKVLNA